MKRTAPFVGLLGTMLALGVLLFSVSGATGRAIPVAAAPRVDFVKEVSNPMPEMGETVTFTLRLFLPSGVPVTVRVYDPNPAPQYLEVLPSTITGGAWYSPTIDGLEWEYMLFSGDEPVELSFQARVRDVHEPIPETGIAITNVAVMLDPEASGSLPEQMARATIYLGGSRTRLPVVYSDAILGQPSLAQEDASVPVQPAADSTEMSLLTPLIFSGYCAGMREIVSPFSIEIAAMHEVSGAGSAGLGGSESMPVWMSMSDQEFVHLLDALQESGAGWTRVRLPWRSLQADPPPADYSGWEWYDVRLAKIAETGVRVIATVADTPDWAGEAPCAPIYEDRLDEFAQFLTDLVQHYQQPPYEIHHWELFNEPDGTWMSGSSGGLGCWADDQTDADGRVYARMLETASQAIKAADPEAVVLMGGVAHDWFTEAPYFGPFDRYFPDDVMKHGGGEYVDALNMHYFRDWYAEWERWDPDSQDRRMGWLPAPTCGDLFDGVGATYEAWGVDVHAKATHLSNRLSTCFGVDKPLWITEIAEHGYADRPDSLANQARYVIQGYARALAAGVENITWYALTTPNDPYEQGLLYEDWSPKPAFVAYQTMTAELTGYEYASTLALSEGEAYLFSGVCNEKKAVAWGGGTLTVGESRRVRVVNRWGDESVVVDGGARDADGTQNGRVAIQLSSDPVFVEPVVD